MSVQLELQLLGLLGLAIHYLKLWVKANNEGKEYNLKKSIPSAALSAITTGVLIYLRTDIENIYVVTPFGAVILGYLGNSVFFSVVETRKPKLGVGDVLATEDDGPGSNPGSPPPPPPGGFKPPTGP